MNSAAFPRRIQRATDYVLDGIESLRFPRGSALPSIRRLAPLAGVSYVTMWKAIKNLQAQGILTAVAGQPTRVSLAPTDIPNPHTTRHEEPRVVPAKRRSVDNVKEAIERDILDGSYEAGSTLPLIKQLRSRYTSAHRTVAEALSMISRDGLIQSHGRRYEVSRPSSRDSSAAICTLVERMYLDRYLAGVPQGHEYLTTLEFLASKLSVKPIVAECSYANSQLFPDDPDFAFPPMSKGNRTMIGYIYLMNHPQVSTRLFDRLRKQGKPVSILDEGRPWDYTQLLGGNPLFRIFPVGVTPRPGAAVGRFLLSLGHRRIAWFSPYQSVPWSDAREQGLVEVYAKAGEGCEVKRLTLFVKTELESIDRVATEAETRFADIADKNLSPDALQRRQDRRAYLRATYRGQENMRAGLLRLFTEALDDTRITAWAMANDSAAILAQDFLQSRRIKVPERISIVSFDDSVSALACRLSSYSFNTNGIVNAALRHIMEYSHKPKHNGPQYVEIEGLVVERETTGRAAGGEVHPLTNAH